MTMMLWKATNFNLPVAAELMRQVRGLGNSQEVFSSGWGVTEQVVDAAKKDIKTPS